MNNSIMFQGTTSDAGKTVITALFCRHLMRKGIRVSPFKAQNLSLNSFVTREGREMGISQAFQAWAAGEEPSHLMNPILLKPKGNSGCQIVLEGKPYRDAVFGRDRMDMDILLEAISDSFEALALEYDAIVVEGSGSPAEINLRHRDIANMRTAELTDSPVILIGDIDKGGVFAGLYGTWELLGEHQHMVKGFIINRFRGDEGILASGIERLEGMMGIPCLGVVPYVPVRLPAEDSLSMSTGEMGRADDVRKAWMENLDTMLDAIQGHLDLDALEGIMRKGL